MCMKLRVLFVGIFLAGFHWSPHSLGQQGLFLPWEVSFP